MNNPVFCFFTKTMSIQRKTFLSLFTVILITIFLSFSKGAFAQEVLINEFAAVTELADWVELYNSTEIPVDLSGWLLRDNTETNKVELNGLICPKSFRKFDFSNRLNDGGDTIRLFSSDNNLQDTVPYFSDLIPKHEEGESTGRSPDGGSDWLFFKQPTPNDFECQILMPTPNSTPTPSPKPPTPTVKPNATYKINEVKDEDGEILNNVKVYIDDVYLHHYAPEVLTFCDDCQCDTDVDCGFSQHVIKLEKTGYHDWSETKTFGPSDFIEVSPVMIFSESISTPTPSVSPTPTPKATVTPSLTPKVISKTASDSGEVLGEEVATLSAFYPYQASDGAEENEASLSAKNRIFPKVFLVSGLLIIFVSAFWAWYRLWYTQSK